jgi:hypothetical protein
MAIKKTDEIIETQAEEVIETPTETSNDEIEVGSPIDLRPSELPLVVKLPKDASAAQVEYAKTLNVYAYKNPAKFEAKKDDKIVNGVLVKGLISKLKDLKDAPEPTTEGKLRINNSFI